MAVALHEAAFPVQGAVSRHFENYLERHGYLAGSLSHPRVSSWVEHRQESPNSVGDDVFTYTPLQSNSEIRMLELLPITSDDQTIQLKIHHIDLDRPKHQYTALSYVWGSADLSHRIVCDGKSTWVTANLYSALQRIRKGKLATYLWIDAICINQGRTEEAFAERSRQVEKMHLIFGRAQNVIVDLGEATETISLFRSVISRFHLFTETEWSQLEERAGEEDLQDILASLTKMTDLVDMNHPFWNAHDEFMQRPWFTRVWMIQEFTLAPSPVFLIGDETEEAVAFSEALERLAKFARWIWQCDVRKGFDYHLEFSKKRRRCGTAEAALSQLKYFRETFPTTKFRLAFLLTCTQLCQATDCRDRLYAVLSLAGDPELMDYMGVDYSEDAVGLSCRISLYLLELGYGPFVLYNCVGADERNLSWAHVLDDPPDDRLVALYKPWDADALPLNAAGSTEFSHVLHYDTNHSVITGRPQLVVPGLVLDTVTSMASDLPPQHKIPADFVMTKYLDQWRQERLTWMISILGHTKRSFNALFKACMRSVMAGLAQSEGHEGRDFNRIDVGEETEDFDNTTELSVYEFPTGLDEPKVLPVSFSQAEYSAYITMMSRSLVFSYGRRLVFCEKHDLICSMPGGTRTGDKIVILDGCPLPFALRQEGDHYRVVGCGYVDGLMDGEAFDDDRWTREQIHIG